MDPVLLDLLKQFGLPTVFAAWLMMVVLPRLTTIVRLQYKLFLLMRVLLKVNGLEELADMDDDDADRSFTGEHKTLPFLRKKDE